MSIRCNTQNSRGHIIRDRQFCSLFISTRGFYALNLLGLLPNRNSSVTANVQVLPEFQPQTERSNELQYTKGNANVKHTSLIDYASPCYMQIWHDKLCALRRCVEVVWMCYTRTSLTEDSGTGLATFCLTERGHSELNLLSSHIFTCRMETRGSFFLFVQNSQ